MFLRAVLEKIKYPRINALCSAYPHRSLPRPEPANYFISSRSLNRFHRLYTSQSQPQHQLTKCCSKKENENETRKSALSLSFWSSKTGWKRAAVNTLRCLAGCTLGDFSALWVLQSLYGHWGMGAIMGVSMASGVTTSILLETILLRRGADKLPWGMAFRTATGMSLVSMLAMETVQNLVDFHLTGGVVLLDDPRFWAAALVSMGAGFLAPMPYNYWRLVRYGKGCH